MTFTLELSSYQVPTPEFHKVYEKWNFGKPKNKIIFYLRISWCFSDRVRVETADRAWKEGGSYILFGEPPVAGRNLYYSSSPLHQLSTAYLPRESSWEGSSLETLQYFLIMLGIKPLMYLLEISIFSLNNVIVRLTKIMNRSDKNCAYL